MSMVFCMVLFSACSEIGSQISENGVLSMSDSRISPVGTVLTLYYQTDYDWICSCAEPWIEVLSPTQGGSGFTELKVKIHPNLSDGADDRPGTLLFTSVDDPEKIYDRVNIMQEKPYFDVKPDELVWGWDECGTGYDCTKEIKVKTNLNILDNNDDSDFLCKSSSSEDGTIIISLVPKNVNDTDIDRTELFMVEADVPEEIRGNYSREINLIQRHLIFTLNDEYDDCTIELCDNQRDDIRRVKVCCDDDWQLQVNHEDKDVLDIDYVPRVREQDISFKLNSDKVLESDREVVLTIIADCGAKKTITVKIKHVMEE